MSELHAALAAEAEGRFIESFSLCNKALSRDPNDPDGLNLMGRLCFLANDLASAIALQRTALRNAPSHPRAHNDLARALAKIPAPEQAAAAYTAAAELAPDIVSHHLAPPACKSFDALADARKHIERAITLDPSHARAHAALGNILVRELNYFGAIASYRCAVALDPNLADVHLALSELYHLVRESERSDSHRALALARQRVYPAYAASRDAMYHVLMLMRDAPFSVNAPLDLVVDQHRVAMHRFYIDGTEPVDTLPHYDVIFNAIGHAEAAQPAIEAASAFISSQDKPSINLPERLKRTARERLPETLHGIDNIFVPRTQRVRRTEIRAQHEPCPILVRPLDTHAGIGLQRIANGQELATYLSINAATELYITPFVEYRGRDGYYRKYRVIIVDGVAYPYHLAISAKWMIHYWSSDMAHVEWMRREEEAFLADPHSVFPQWNATFGAIGAAIGLDYVGLDVALLNDGTMLIFEADAAMLVQDEDPGGVFAYKRSYLADLFKAIETMIARRSHLSRSPNAWPA